MHCHCPFRTEVCYCKSQCKRTLWKTIKEYTRENIKQTFRFGEKWNTNLKVLHYLDVRVIMRK